MGSSTSPEADDLGPLADVIRTVRPKPRGGRVPGHSFGNAADPEHSLRRWEGLVERAIRDAQDAGAFDNLPYQGQRLPLEDDSAAGDLASAFRLMRNAGAAPRWIEADREIRRLLVERDRLLDRASRAGPLMRKRDREEFRRVVENVNAAVLILNHEAPTPMQHRRPLDVDAEVAALEARWPHP